MSRVCVFQHRLLHYRVEFFEKLRKACAANGIELILVHGQATRHEASRKDTGELAWANRIENVVWRVGGKDLIWQPSPAAVKGADLIVLMQENRILSNYPWLFARGLRQAKVAFWGHGRNFQSSAPTGWRERWKAAMLRRVDWWFAYTETSREALLQAGFPAQRITVLNNAVNNASFAEELDSVSKEELVALRASVGATATSPLGLYCGSLYPDKRLDLMLEAGQKVADQIPGFKLIVIGDGPSRSLLLSRELPWLHSLGVVRGRAKAAWFRAADVFVSPGAVGLHVLDSFVSGVPLVTTADALHGPEVAYLENGKNGVVVNGGAESYAAALISLLQDAARLAEIRGAALRDAQRYTLEAMVQNFVEGIKSCLGSEALG